MSDAVSDSGAEERRVEKHGIHSRSAHECSHRSLPLLRRVSRIGRHGELDRDEVSRAAQRLPRCRARCPLNASPTCSAHRRIPSSQGHAVPLSSRFRHFRSRSSQDAPGGQEVRRPHAAGDVSVATAVNASQHHRCVRRPPRVQGVGEGGAGRQLRSGWWLRTRVPSRVAARRACIGSSSRLREAHGRGRCPCCRPRSD